jgi:hypothetical protein
MEVEQPWIGLVHVQPKEGFNPLGPGLKGAFAHVIALATDSESYQERAHRALDEDGFYVIEFRDVSPAWKYRTEGRIPEDMEDLLLSLSPNNQVQFDTFDAYRDHDA